MEKQAKRRNPGWRYTILFGILAASMALSVTGCDDSESVVRNEPPTAAITAPENGATVTQGEAVTLAGSAEDPEDGAITGGGLVWRSDLSGRIGVGESLVLRDLAAGTHTISLTAADSGGATDTAAVTLVVAPDESLKTGRFAAPPVAGLAWTAGGRSGITDPLGTFTYHPGETVTFSIGDVVLGEAVPAKPALAPMDLAPDALGPRDPAAVNIGRLLLTLDVNGDPRDGIGLPEGIHDLMAGAGLDFALSDEAFTAAAQGLVDGIYGEGARPLLPAADAGLVLTGAVLSLTETVRDERGVWSIEGAEHLYSIFEAMGHAVAVDRLWQAETFRRAGLGRLAEIFGPEQLESDIFVRTIGYSREELDQEFAALDRECRTVITAYVDGFNRRLLEIAEDPTLLPFEFYALSAHLGIEFVPEPWEPTDVLAWAVLMLREFDPEALRTAQIDNGLLLAELVKNFPENYFEMFEDLRWTTDPDALTYISAAEAAEGRLHRAAVPPPPEAIPDIGPAARRLKEIRSRMVAGLEKINARVRMGSYAWVVSGEKTASGDPILYSGPQMGFSVPAMVVEGAVRAGGFQISGMGIPGLPGIIIGRTPHHAWSMQVGHARTTDYYFELPQTVALHRVETIRVAGGEDVQLPVYRSAHGPVINPLPYDPGTYVPSPEDPIISWKYAHWGYELDTIGAYLGLARARTMDQFGESIERVGVSQHFCYADRDGNIAYWMSGRHPQRVPGEYRLPQGFFGDVLEWDARFIRPRSTARNPAKGYIGGWNNKTSPHSLNAYNNTSYYFGDFHRAHVIDAFLSGRDDLTFEEVRDLALSIAVTDSFGNGGNPWPFVAGAFQEAVAGDPTPERTAALEILSDWDGRFVAGGPENWVDGPDRSDGWMLMDAWIREALRLTFEDELGPEVYAGESKTILFNVFLRGLFGGSDGVVNKYFWFKNRREPDAPQRPDTVITTALDHALAALGDRPWGIGARGEIVFEHDLIGEIHAIPFASRSTYAHCVAYGPEGPVRIESMFPLGESGMFFLTPAGEPQPADPVFSMAPVFDTFAHRPFPGFDTGM